MGGGRLSDERGHTLVELLVSMTVGLVVLAATLSVLVTGLRSSHVVDRRVDALDRASFGLERLRTQLRGAIELRPAVTAATDRSAVEARLWVTPGTGPAEQRWVRFACSTSCVRTDLTTGQDQVLVEAVDGSGGAPFTLRPPVSPAVNGPVDVHLRVAVRGSSRPVLLETTATPRPCADGLPSGSTTCPG